MVLSGGFSLAASQYRFPSSLPRPERLVPIARIPRSRGLGLHRLSVRGHASGPSGAEITGRPGCERQPIPNVALWTCLAHSHMGQMT